MSKQPAKQPRVKKPAYTLAVINRVLAEYTAGASVPSLMQKYNFSEASFYNWKRKYVNKGDGADKDRHTRVDAVRNRHTRVGLEAENARLRDMLVTLLLENEDLKKHR